MTKKDESIERRVSHFQAVAAAAGLKLTHQRIEIFREVAGRLDHPDAESVYRAVKPRVPTISLDTVYRTLRVLVDLGLLGTLGSRQDSLRFDSNTAPHHHYICVRCGTAKDFFSGDFDTLAAPETVTGFGSVLSRHVEIRGICEACLRAEREGGRTGRRMPIRE